MISIARRNAHSIHVSNVLKRFIALLPWMFTLVSPVFADAYLDALEAEANKAEGAVIEEQAATAGPATASSAPSEVDQAAFENELKTHYLGTFNMYKSLPERSRQEVIIDYQRGASMDEVRNKIVARLLNN